MQGKQVNSGRRQQDNGYIIHARHQLAPVRMTHALAQKKERSRLRMPGAVQSALHFEKGAVQSALHFKKGCLTSIVHAHLSSAECIALGKRFSLTSIVHAHRSSAECIADQGWVIRQQKVHMGTAFVKYKSNTYMRMAALKAKYDPSLLQTCLTLSRQHRLVRRGHA
eukprot:1153661-Pelagomonas_calceolata.AAC.3